MQTTLVILKPDCVARRLAGEVITRIERKGLQLVGMKLLKIPAALARRMYTMHKGKDFYEPLVRFMTRGPVIVVAVRGKDAVEVVRKLCGSTFGADADPGTIRGDFGVSRRFNIVHASDSPGSAKRELALFFRRTELVKDVPPDFGQIYDTTDGALV